MNLERFKLGGKRRLWCDLVMGVVGLLTVHLLSDWLTGQDFLVKIVVPLAGAFTAGYLARCAAILLGERIAAIKRKHTGSPNG